MEDGAAPEALATAAASVRSAVGAAASGLVDREVLVELIVLGLHLSGATHVSLRLVPPLLVVGDTARRILVYDVTLGRRLRNIRIR